MLNEFLPEYKTRRLKAGFYNKSVPREQLNKSINYYNNYF